MGAGAWIIAATLLTGEPPAVVARPINEITVFAKHTVNEVQGNAPKVRLGVKGGETELDWCDGSFIEYQPYAQEDPNLQPTFVAHNLCGGDAILYVKEVGTVIDIVDQNGMTSPYKVTEIRDIVSEGNTGDLLGIKGDLVLQTCNLDDRTIHFVAVEPVNKPQQPTAEQAAVQPVVHG